MPESSAHHPKITMVPGPDVSSERVLATAVGMLAEKVGELTVALASSARSGAETPSHRVDLDNLVDELRDLEHECLELRTENERLRVAQRNLEIAAEEAQSLATESRRLLAELGTSRGWKLLNWYWGMLRRVRRRRPSQAS